MGAKTTRARTRWRLAAALAVVGAISGAAMFVRPAPALIYNPSPSVPRGFYVRDHEPIAVGAFVTLRAVDASPAYARARYFTDRTDRFIKRVAAVGGTLVCAEGDHVTVPGRGAIARLARDTAGRVLPSWDGCRTLGADEVFLLGDTADSFDSRYWGPVRVSTVDGVWRPLF
jgi:type IV secretory pathway protease TraF